MLQKTFLNDFEEEEEIFNENLSLNSPILFQNKSLKHLNLWNDPNLFSPEDLPNFFNFPKDEENKYIFSDPLETERYFINKPPKDKMAVLIDSKTVTTPTGVTPQIKKSITNSSNININNNNFVTFSIESKNRFKTFLYHKRGRKAFVEKENRIIHGALDFDNIQRKIQVHFISFLVDLANDAVASILGPNTEINFKKVNYKIKRTVNHDFIEKMKKSSYSDVLKMNISSNYKYLSVNHNANNYSLACKNSAFLEKFFAQNYLNFFQRYYYNHEKPLKEIYFEDKIITLSSKTKNYFDLIQKNRSSKEILNKVLKTVYFNKVNYFKGVKFITSNSKNELVLPGCDFEINIFK